VDTVTIAAAILDWVADRIGTSREELPATIARRKSDRDRIAAGNLTVPQVQKIAKKARVPFGVLFLSQPPATPQLDIPDLRQTVNPLPLDDDFFDTYADALAKHAWYRRQLIGREAKRPTFVGRFRASTSRSARAVAADIVSTLGITDRDRARSRSADDYFTCLAKKAEEVGVLVMKASYVKAQTRRPLAVTQFRGFAIADGVAPLVFVNGNDAHVATVFTLMHELAHIWIGESGVSEVEIARASGIEAFCNNVAAEILVPTPALRGEWARVQDVQAVAKHFRVSRFVAGIHLARLGLITQEHLDAVLSVPLPRRQKAKVSQIVLVPIRNSRRLTAELVNSAARGETLYRDAASLLNVKPDTVVALYERSKGRRVAEG
jgi:Zn-dependent peptidase ImmA (M78 family)